MATRIMNIAEYSQTFPKEAVTSYTGSRDGEGVSRQAILYRINKNLPLPNVSKVEKVGRQFILHVKIKQYVPPIKEHTNQLCNYSKP